MKLNTIQREGSWSNIADSLNENFSKVDNAVEALNASTIKNIGYFSTVDALREAYPIASAGAKAYVGLSYPFAIYLWDATTSTWMDSGETGGEESVNLSDYYTKEEIDGKLESQLTELGSKVGEKATKDELQAEVTRATNAENALTKSVAAETSRATRAELELRKSINNEVLRAKEAEEELENNIHTNRYGYNVTVNGLKGGVHTIETAIKDVPVKFRMLGQKITFRTENGDWATYHNESLSLDNYENVNDWVQEVGISSVQGDVNITNAPDYEDLTEAANGTIKFADKEYNKESFSGLGRVYLRKNIVDGVNVLTQDMLVNSNSIYIIQYDYDLQGAEITIPEGCVLDFQGGSLKNGTVVGDNTAICATTNTIFEIDTNLKGIWDIAEAYIEWFGAKGDGVTDDSDAFRAAVLFSKEIILLSKTYYIADNIIIDRAVNIKGKGYQNTRVLLSRGIDITSNNNCNISGILFEPSENSEFDYLMYIYGAYHVHIENCTFYGKNKSAKTGVKYYGEKNTYYHVITKNRFVELEYGVIFSYNVNGSTIIDNEFYQCDTCVVIDSCNGDRILNNTFQNYIYKAIDLQYNDYGSNTWGNVILGNYFEGTFETALADIDFNSNTSCRFNYIIGNKTTYIPSATNKNYKHIANMNTSNIILESSGATYKYPNKLTGFVVNQIFESAAFDAFATPEFEGCIAPRRKDDGSTDFRVYVRKADGTYEWRNLVLTNKWGTQIDNLNIGSNAILQYYGGYVQLGINAELGANRLTYDPSIGFIKHGGNDGKEWRYLQNVDSREILPDYMPQKGYMIFYEEIGAPVWWDGSKFVDAQGNIKRAGAFSNKPSSQKVGFGYFCTDRQTTEGATYGIMIYHKGDNVWVDALGRVVE